MAAAMSSPSPAWSRELGDELLTCAMVSDALDEIGLRGQVLDNGILPLLRGSRIIGRRASRASLFGLIVTELVINSIKHGFPGGRKGRIVVAYVLGGTGWRLTVFDDGVGRAPGAPARTGLGTSIVEALARSMKANVEISQSGSGAATTIVHAA